MAGAPPQQPYPATVQVAQLPLGTTVTGSEIIHVIQTTSGVGKSVQLTLNQVLSVVTVVGGSGPYTAASLATNAIPYGQGVSPVAALLPATVTGLPLISNGSVAAPTFGVLGLAGGGLGTNSLPNFTVLLGNGSSSIAASSTQTAGQILVGQTATGFPLWKNVAGDISLTAGGVATIAVGAVTFPKIVQVAAGTLLGNPTGNAATIVATTTPTLGTGSATGSLSLAGSNTSVVTLAPGTTSFASYTAMLPPSWGAPGQFLQSNGTLLAAVFTAAPAVSLINFSSLATSPPPLAFDGAVNLGFVPSVSAGVLTITLTNNLGSTPSATSPIYVPFRTSLGTALTTWSVVSSTTTMTTVVGASFGSVANQAFRLWLALFFSNTTTVIPALINCSNATGIAIPPTLNLIGSTIAIGAGSVTSGIFYANSSVASIPYRLVGFMDWGNGLASIGTFSSTPTSVNYVGSDTPRPGNVVQYVSLTQGVTTTIVTTTLTTTNISAAITPLASTNLIRFSTVWSMQYTNVTGVVTGALYRGATVVSFTTRASGTAAIANVVGLDLPLSGGVPVTYVVKAMTSLGSTLIPGVTGESSMVLEEIMG
jgi:hypothetical protein